VNLSWWLPYRAGTGITNLMTGSRQDPQARACVQHHDVLVYLHERFARKDVEKLFCLFVVVKNLGCAGRNQFLNHGPPRIFN